MANIQKKYQKIISSALQNTHIPVLIMQHTVILKDVLMYIIYISLLILSDHLLYLSNDGSYTLMAAYTV